MPNTPDLYTRLTNKIITDLEQGVMTWRKPWNSERLAGQVTMPLRWNDIPYSGINTVILWIVAAEKGYTSPYWMTVRQANKQNARVRRGEKAAPVVYADSTERHERLDDGTLKNVTVHYLKQYSVFNATQIEGLPERFHATTPACPQSYEEHLEHLNTFFDATGADIVTGVKAAYRLNKDEIEMAPFASFDGAESYFTSLAREVTRWTGHPNRLSRDFNGKAWNGTGEAMEALVAELGMCFLAADLGFAPAPSAKEEENITVWIRAMRDDKRFFFQAAAYAQKAVTFIKEAQNNPAPQADTVANATHAKEPEHKAAKTATAKKKKAETKKGQAIATQKNARYTAKSQPATGTKNTSSPPSPM